MAVFVILTIGACAYLYSSGIRHAETYATASNTSFFVSSHTGIKEWFDFTNQIAPNFSPSTLGIGAIIIVVFLEGMLVIRLRAQKGKGVLWHKIIYSILYQVLVIIGFFVMLFAGMYLATKVLMDDAGKYLASHPELVSAMNAQVTTDKNGILAAIKTDSSRLIVLEDPRLIGSSLDSGLTFFQAYAVPRYLRLEDHVTINKFLDYSVLPYYFIAPNYLIVKDKKQFMEDVGPIAARNIVDSLLSSYTKGVSSPRFTLLPLGQYQSEYKNRQVHNLEGSISSLQNEIQENQDVIAKNDQIIAQAKTQPYYSAYPDKLTNLEDQADSIKQQALTINAQDKKYVEQYRQSIADYSDPTSIAYREGQITIGAFIPPSEIILREPGNRDQGPASLGQPAPEKMSEILRVMVHESLHYYASIDQSTTATGLNDFLFEGFTDYFALKAMGYTDSEMPYAAGYPVHVQIISLLAQKIPLSELEKINFTGNQDLFKTDFKKYFPDSDYQAFTSLGNEIAAWWFKTGFGNYNVSYVNDSYVEKAQAILKIPLFK